MQDRKEIKSIGVIGLGYIGLPTAAMFAASGARVHGVDVSDHVRQAVNAGRPHIEEGDLDALVASVVGEGRLTAHAEPMVCDAFIIAVPTPVKDDKDRKPDLAYVRQAALSIAPVLRPGALVVLESTSPVGTTELVRDLLSEQRDDLKFPGQDHDVVDVHIAYCPERIIPGRMLEELVSNDRIIGGLTRECSAIATQLYKRFVKGACIECDARTAEMVKLTENAFRDVNIAFANELSMICDDIDVDAWEVIRLANRHPRVSILSPGAGVGGHCIAVDPWFIISRSPELSILMRAAREVNDSKARYVVDMLSEMLDQNPSARLLCLGLTYKPDVDDFRESPALEIAKELTRRHSARVLCSDPYSDRLEPQDVAIELGAGDCAELASKSDIVAILVGHKEYQALSLGDDVNVIDIVGLMK